MGKYASPEMGVVLAVRCIMKFSTGILMFCGDVPGNGVSMLFNCNHLNYRYLLWFWPSLGGNV